MLICPLPDVLGMDRVGCFRLLVVSVEAVDGPGEFYMCCVCWGGWVGGSAFCLS